MSLSLGTTTCPSTPGRGKKWTRGRELHEGDGAAEVVEGENDGAHEERPIDEMVREFETDLRCRMVTTRRSEEGLVVMVEDGACSQVVIVQYRGQDTNIQEDDPCAVKYVHGEEGWDFPAVFQFIVQDE